MCDFVGTVGLVAKYCGAEFAHLFAGEGDEEDGAFGARAGGEDFGGFDDRGDARGVVHGAVVDVVAVDGPADAEVIEMGADDDVFVLELAVGAFEFRPMTFWVSMVGIVS